MVGTCSPFVFFLNRWVAELNNTIVRFTIHPITVFVEANDTLSSMHSMATTSSTQGKNDQQKDCMATDDEEYRSYVEGQRRLLEMDDIVEDEDENSMGSNQKQNPLHEVDEIIILD
jgi:hypothetical protein